jgi:hypothetical protein
MNLLKIVQTFATEDQALDYLVASRWPDGVRRLACDHGKVYQIDGRGKTGKPFRRQVNAARFLPCEKHMVSKGCVH